MAKVGKRIREARAKVDRNKAYPLDEAIKLVKATSSVPRTRASAVAAAPLNRLWVEG